MTTHVVADLEVFTRILDGGPFYCSNESCVFTDTDGEPIRNSWRPSVNSCPVCGYKISDTKASDKDYKKQRKIGMEG